MAQADRPAIRSLTRSDDERSRDSQGQNVSDLCCVEGEYIETMMEERMEMESKQELERVQQMNKVCLYTHIHTHTHTHTHKDESEIIILYTRYLKCYV